MILRQSTSYVLVYQLNSFIVYNIHLHAGNVNAFGAEKQDGQSAYHHHQGQNRPYRKIITYPHGTPQSHLRNTHIFSVG